MAEPAFFELGKGNKNILIIHGWGADKSKFKLLGQKLAFLGWHVVALDLPGFGQTPPPERIFNITDYANLVGEFAQELFDNKSYILFGHSFGGRVAIKLTIVDKNIKGLILCSSSGIIRGNFLKRYFLLVLAKIGNFLRLGKLWKKLLYKLAREHDYEKTSGIVRAIFRQIIREDLKPILPQIKVPTLILWGEKDKLTPLKGAYIAQKLIKRSIVSTFANIGHALPYRKPAGVAREITTWSKTFWP